MLRIILGAFEIHADYSAQIGIESADYALKGDKGRLLCLPLPFKNSVFNLRCLDYPTEYL